MQCFSIEQYGWCCVYRLVRLNNCVLNKKLPLKCYWEGLASAKRAEFKYKPALQPTMPLLRKPIKHCLHATEPLWAERGYSLGERWQRGGQRAPWEHSCCLPPLSDVVNWLLTCRGWLITPRLRHHYGKNVLRNKSHINSCHAVCRFPDNNRPKTQVLWGERYSSMV